MKRPSIKPSQYPFYRSPNFGERKSGGRITLLVLHYTVITFSQTKRSFLNPESSVSAHYVVDTDGRICQFVDESKRAWHAGLSYWDDITDVNSYSIGIEIVNSGYVESKAFSPYPAKQISAVINLAKEITRRYHIKPYNVMGHSDVSPNRKIDPGPHFPWQTLACAGIGLFPTNELLIQQKPAGADILKLLKEFGYDASSPQVKRAFQLHYTPQKWLHHQSFNEDEIRILQALLMLKNQ